SACLRERQPLAGMLTRARRHIATQAGRVGLAGGRLDPERIALPPTDGVPLARSVHVGRMLRVHTGRAREPVTRIVDAHDDLVRADRDFTHLVEHREERYGLYIAQPIGDQLRLSGTAFRRDWPARHGAESRAQRLPGGRPATRETFGGGQLERARI